MSPPNQYRVPQSKRVAARSVALTLEVTGVGDDDGAGLLEGVEGGGHGAVGWGDDGCCSRERRPLAA